MRPFHPRPLYFFKSYRNQVSVLESLPTLTVLTNRPKRRAMETSEYDTAADLQLASLFVSRRGELRIRSLAIQRELEALRYAEKTGHSVAE